ncbi:hypothetical protein DV515_00019020 [Chloebia gouldiae]|uniref:Protein phosphatase 1 regulatory subunit 1A n=1 Tax=Chloebia gouldiae TaxID=44316 RepID=A0A3L8Q5Y2_CHLGU|nr:hypothetical protein DV515_00019020 [Chloebia gouldiae]
MSLCPSRVPLSIPVSLCPSCVPVSIPVSLCLSPCPSVHPRVPRAEPGARRGLRGAWPGRGRGVAGAWPLGAAGAAGAAAPAMEPNSPRKIQFTVPLLEPHLDPEAAEQVRRHRGDTGGTPGRHRGDTGGTPGGPRGRAEERAGRAPEGCGHGGGTARAGGPGGGAAGPGGDAGTAATGGCSLPRPPLSPEPRGAVRRGGTVPGPCAGSARRHRGHPGATPGPPGPAPGPGHGVTPRGHGRGPPGTPSPSCHLPPPWGLQGTGELWGDPSAPPRGPEGGEEKRGGPYRVPPAGGPPRCQRSRGECGAATECAHPGPPPGSAAAAGFGVPRREGESLGVPRWEEENLGSGGSKSPPAPSKGHPQPRPHQSRARGLGHCPARGPPCPALPQFSLPRGALSGGDPGPVRWQQVTLPLSPPCSFLGCPLSDGALGRATPLRVAPRCPRVLRGPPQTRPAPPSEGLRPAAPRPSPQLSPPVFPPGAPRCQARPRPLSRTSARVPSSPHACPRGRGDHPGGVLLGRAEPSRAPPGPARCPLPGPAPGARSRGPLPVPEAAPSRLPPDRAARP